MPYAASLRRKSNARYRRGPYRKRMPYGIPYPSARPRATISQGGVGGGQLVMRAGFQSPQEVKAYYSTITSAPGNDDWNVISPNTVVAGIRQGVGGNERIGRNIRLVGMSMRLSVNTQTATVGATAGGEPYTVDIILDKRPNGAQATIGQIYATADLTSLPNPNFVDRFVFLRRIEVRAAETANTMVNCTIKLNKVCNFEGLGAGVITDLETNNIIVCAAAQDATPVYTGNIGVMYVDA